MADTEAKQWEDQLIATMRANGGAITDGPLAGHPLLIMTSRGAKTGEPRRAILTWSRDGDDYIVAGTAGGSPTAPALIHNLRANPDVTLEVANREHAGTATVIADGAERDRLWNQHVAALPWFGPYPEQSGRIIPMVRLTPTS